MAVGALGSAFSFKRKTERHSGQSEYYKLTQWLCKQDTVETVYVLSRCDYETLSDSEKDLIDPKRKIKTINEAHSKYKLSKKALDGLTDRNDILDVKYEVVKQRGELVYDQCKDADFAIIFPSQGSYSRSTMPGYIYSNRPKLETQRVAALEMTANYAGHMTYFLNKWNKNYVMFPTDPRYTTKRMYPFDLYNLPIAVLGQFNQMLNWDHINKFTAIPTDYEKENVMVQHKYAGIEKMNLIDETLIDPATPRDKRFVIISKQVDIWGTPIKKDFRYQCILDWILKEDKNQESVIYGQWDDFKMEGWPQMRGFLETEKLNTVMTESKYTLVLPTKAGWATSKAWEVLAQGVVPFFHSDYDKQNNMIPADHYFRCKDPKELYKKMEELDKNDSLRIELVRAAQKEFLSDAVNGEFLRALINKQGVTV